jgi:hypothetical protein
MPGEGKVNGQMWTLNESNRYILRTFGGFGFVRARNATMNRIEENEGNNENGLSRKAARFLQGE